MQSLKKVLITGAGTGIGAAIARALSNDGFEVILHYRRSKESVNLLQKELAAKGGAVRTLNFDVTDRKEVKTRLDEEIAANGSFYGCVLNAGLNRDAAFPMLSDDDWDEVINTNLNGFYNVLKPLIMPMISAHEGGRIVAISSVSGLIGNRGQVNYAASKAALTGAIKSLGLELGKRNITVNAVAPGLIDTAMTDLETHVKQEILKMIPLKRMGKPEEVANLVSFLMSDKASYITRQVFTIDGGLS